MKQNNQWGNWSTVKRDSRVNSPTINISHQFACKYNTTRKYRTKVLGVGSLDGPGKDTSAGVRFRCPPPGFGQSPEPLQP